MDPVAGPGWSSSRRGESAHESIGVEVNEDIEIAIGCRLAAHGGAEDGHMGDALSLEFGRMLAQVFNAFARDSTITKSPNTRCYDRVFGSRFQDTFAGDPGRKFRQEGTCVGCYESG